MLCVFDSNTFLLYRFIEIIFLFKRLAFIRFSEFYKKKTT